MDRRVRRTRTQLTQALYQLIQEKPYDTITIQDITDTADLNRATFYLHYGSKEELLLTSLEAEFDALVERIGAETIEGPHWEDPFAMQLVFDYVAERPALYKVLLGSNGHGYVMRRVLDYIARYDEFDLRTVFADDELNVPIPILARHAAGSLFSLIVWWLEEDLPYTPAEMAQMAQQLCFVGVHATMKTAVLKTP